MHPKTEVINRTYVHSNINRTIIKQTIVTKDGLFENEYIDIKFVPKININYIKIDSLT